MFKPATTAFLITTAVTSVLAAPHASTPPRGTIGQIAPSGLMPPVQFKAVREDSDVEARFVCPGLGCGPGPVMNPPSPLFRPGQNMNPSPLFRAGPVTKMAREDLDAPEVAVPGIKGASSRFITWLLNKLQSDADQKDVQAILAREDFELEARGKLGKAATSVGGQAANGAAGALTSWALNKLRREDLLEVRDVIEELLERDDQEYSEARELLEDYLEARDFELDDLE